jgi:Ras homolog gene family, member A
MTDEADICQEDVPLIFHHHIADVQVDGKNVQLMLWDTPAADAYERIRPLSYPNTDAALICFAIDSPHSLKGANEKVRSLLFSCKAS